MILKFLKEIIGIRPAPLNEESSARKSRECLAVVELLDGTKLHRTFSDQDQDLGEMNTTPLWFGLWRPCCRTEEYMTYSSVCDGIGSALKKNRG